MSASNKISGAPHNDRSRWCSFSCNCGCSASDHNDIDFEIYEFRCQFRKKIEFSVCISIFKNDIFPLYVAKFS